MSTKNSRLASTKHLAADRPGTDTFASDSKVQESRTERFDTKSPQSTTDYESLSESPDTNVYHYTQLPRRKSIHRRIGRVFLRISKMCSGTDCSTYAYQYGCGASELPAVEPRIEDSTSFYEMPGSSPPVELESQDTQKLSSMQYAQSAPEHLRNYYQANRNATLRRAAPMSVANLSQLPRLEVPQSQHCVPRLISDRSSLTPSPISPLTPEGGARYGNQQPPDSQQYLDAISPCMNSKQGQIFAHYGSWGQQRHQSPGTPSTASSYDPSYATTPMSAYPSSAHSSFHTWPQSQIWQESSSYPQTYAPIHYNQGMNDITLTGTNMWQRSFQDQADNIHNEFPTFQTPDYQQHVPQSSQTAFPTLQPQSCFVKQTQIETVNSFSTQIQSSHTFNEAPPPAYSPGVPDQPPVTSTPPQRYPPAVCQQCGKIFTGKFGPGNCKRHVQQIHASIFDKAIHMCKVCFKTYNRADALRKHQWKKHRLEDARPNKRRERGL